MRHRHTRATPTNTPRSRSKYTSRQRRAAAFLLRLRRAEDRYWRNCVAAMNQQAARNEPLTRDDFVWLADMCQSEQKNENRRGEG